MAGDVTWSLRAAPATLCEFIRTLEGFRGDAVLVRIEGESFDIATFAAWENAAAVSRAKDLVKDFYQRIGFDMHAAMTEWGVTLVRTFCEAPAELQLP
jgi:hypothetical protein